jgi:hypothetical protein
MMTAECFPICSDTVACVLPDADAGVMGSVSCAPLASQPANAGVCIHS